MKRKSLWVVIVFSFIGVYSCTKKENEQRAPQNQVTLIFKNPPPDSFYVYRKKNMRGMADSKLSYFDDHKLPISISPNPEVESDTFRIRTTRNEVEVQHFYRGLESISFFFHKGDTVLFTYSTKIPHAEVLNRKTLPLDLSYEEKRNAVFYGKDLQPAIKYFFPMLYDEDFYSKDKIQQKQFKDSVYALIKRYYETENRFLDSLANEGLISKDVYSSHKKKTFFNFMIIQFQYHEANKDFMPAEMRKEEMKNVLSGGSDSLLYYGFFNYFIREVRKQYYDVKVPRVTSPNSFRPDFRIVYDSIVKNKFISKEIKKALLLHTLKEIIQDNSLSSVKTYTDRFQQDVNDSVWYNYVLKENHLDFKSSNDLLLKDSLGRVYKFDELIRKNIGKVMYVDFWASWCAPCIKELPHAKELKAEYKGKDVEFVYLSFDNDLSRWKKAMRKQDVRVNSFIIDNIKSSQLLEDLNLNTIPRYLLFDKKGNLVHKTAPRPGNEIRKLINRYLVQ